MDNNSSSKYCSCKNLRKISRIKNTSRTPSDPPFSKNCQRSLVGTYNSYNVYNIFNLIKLALLALAHFASNHVSSQETSTSLSPASPQSAISPLAVENNSPFPQSLVTPSSEESIPAMNSSEETLNALTKEDSPISEAENEATCQAELSKSYHQKESLQSENDLLKIRIQSLEYKNKKILQRHSDMILAWSWQFEQLERKAQAYYNNFQTSKANLGSVTVNAKEPNRNRGKGNAINHLIPLLWRSRQNSKNDKATAAQLTQKLNAAIKAQKQAQLQQQEWEQNQENNEENSESEETGNNQAPVQRSISRHNYKRQRDSFTLSTKDVVGITLKSAMADQHERDNPDNNDTGVGTIDLDSEHDNSDNNYNNNSKNPFQARKARQQTREIFDVDFRTDFKKAMGFRQAGGIR